MTGSGGFTPGTPVSTHFQKIMKENINRNEKIQKENKNEKIKDFKK